LAAIRFKRREVVAMRVPAIADRHLVEMDGHHRHACLGQATSELQRTSKAMLAIALARRGRFVGQRKKL